VKSEITKIFTFEAAHHLPPVGPDHKCFRLHGHLFRVEVSVAGELDPAMGWVMDFGDLDRIGRKVIAELDHRVLNDIPGLGVPTSENLARYLFERLAPGISGLSALTVHESPSSRCTYRPGNEGSATGPSSAVTVGNARGTLLSCAHFLLVPPGGREPIHGHDYSLNLSASVPAGKADGIEEALARWGTESTADMDHRILVPGRPVIGRLERKGSLIDMVLPDETLTLPSNDCAVLDIGNTSTEALAGLVALRITRMDAVRSSGATRIEATMTEAGTASARAVLDVTPLNAPV